MNTYNSLSGLPVSVFAPASERDTEIGRGRTVWTHSPEAATTRELADGVLLVDQGGGSIIAVPFSKMAGGEVKGYFGGRFIYTSDSRLRAIADHPIPLFDADVELPFSPGEYDENGALFCDVYFADGFRGCALHGPTAVFDTVRVYGDGAEPNGGAGLDVLIRTEHRSRKGYFFAVPAAYRAINAWTMAGGNFVYQHSQAFASTFGPYPISVHDRCESAELRSRAGYGLALV